MAVEHDTLLAGDTVSAHPYVFETEEVSSYVDVVEDSAWAEVTDGAFVPPMAVVAKGLQFLVKDLEVPPGTVHVAQEFEFFAMVPLGEAIRYHARIAQNVTRKGHRFMSVDVSVEGDGSRPVMTSRSTIVSPE